MDSPNKVSTFFITAEQAKALTDKYWSGWNEEFQMISQRIEQAAKEGLNSMGWTHEFDYKMKQTLEHYGYRVVDSVIYWDK